MCVDVRDFLPFPRLVGSSVENKTAASNGDEICVLEMDDKDNHSVDDDFNHSSDNDNNESEHVVIRPSPEESEPALSHLQRSRRHKRPSHSCYTYDTEIRGEWSGHSLSH